MWKLSPEDDYLHKLKKWPKKYKRELRNVHDNLDTFQKTLNTGVKPIQAKFGFVHTEPMGILAVDQKGKGQSMKQTRLYFFPDETDETLYLLTLGDKSSQEDDIALCKQFVKDHLANSETEETVALEMTLRNEVEEHVKQAK